MCSTSTSSSNNKLSATMSRQPKHVEFFTTLLKSVTDNQMPISQSIDFSCKAEYKNITLNQLYSQHTVPFRGHFLGPQLSPPAVNSVGSQTHTPPPPPHGEQICRSIGWLTAVKREKFAKVKQSN